MEINKEIILKDKNKQKKSIGLIHKVYLAQLRNKYIHTAFTKTKSEVRGGGKKPWRQKGTGNARAGSRRSPLWVGGGICFGPKPHIVSKKINKKEKKIAILSALYLKKNDFTLFSDNSFDESFSYKTKNILAFLKSLGIDEEKKILLVSEKPDSKLWYATRNLKNINLVTAKCLNLEQLIKTNKIILSNNTFAIINSIYGKSTT